MRDKYTGNDQVHTTSGAGMEIDQIGDSFVHTPTRPLHLNHINYVPKANKNLVFVHGLPLIIMPSLSLTLIIFSRIRQRGEFSLDGIARVASTL